MCEALSQESKCVSLKVGAILVKDGRIISTGINGTPTGFINCCSKFTERCDEHTTWSLVHEIHAEMNCILFAAKNGISTNNTIMYVTHEPCQQCLKNLAQSGVVKVYYKYKYYNETLAQKEEKGLFLSKLNLILQQLKLSE